MFRLEFENGFTNCFTFIFSKLTLFLNLPKFRNKEFRATLKNKYRLSVASVLNHYYDFVDISSNIYYFFYLFHLICRLKTCFSFVNFVKKYLFNSAKN